MLEICTVMEIAFAGKPAPTGIFSVRKSGACRSPLWELAC